MEIKLNFYCVRFDQINPLMLITLVILLCCYFSFGQQTNYCNNEVTCITPIDDLKTSGIPVSLTVSSTCGTGNASNQYASYDTPNTILYCFPASDGKGNILDTIVNTNFSITNPNLQTYWQSENTFINTTSGFPSPPTPTVEYVILNVTYPLLIRSVSMVFASPGVAVSSQADMRPRAMKILAWSLGQWTPWRYYADSCLLRYDIEPYVANSGTISNPTVPVCEQLFFSGDETTLENLGYGLQEVMFLPYIDYKTTFSSVASVQSYFITSALKFEFDYPAVDSNLFLSYYAIADIDVEFQCACFGHASDCTPNTFQCECQHNTTGPNCQQCLPLFNNVPWQMSVYGQNASVCEDCGCNAHSSLCQYSPVLELGICTNCIDNTAGDKCNSCIDYYYVNPNPNANNFPNNNCSGVASPLQPAIIYNCTNYCIPCNCNQTGSYGGDCDPESGNCTCKSNVMGRACDTCQPGFWNLNNANVFGCQACVCNAAGSLNSIMTCNTLNGTCICKAFTEGVLCDQCQVGYFNLDINNPQGCTACNCDVGASSSVICPVVGGQCSCKNNIGGRDCRQPLSGYFGPVLDYLTFEAEFSSSVIPSQIVLQYGAGNWNATNTGPGFVNVSTSGSLSMNITAPFTFPCSLVVRYETGAMWTGVIATLILENPSSAPTQTYTCNNVSYTVTTPQQLTGVTITPKNVQGAVVMGTVCLLQNMQYNLVLEFLTSSPPIASILIDSAVLIPVVTLTNSYHLSNVSMQSLMVQCSQVQESVNNPLVQNYSCPQLGYSIMTELLSGAIACSCNAVGSYNMTCNPIGGQCYCNPNIFMRECSMCEDYSYGFALSGCIPCNCDPNGSYQSSCNSSGICSCKPNVIGNQCNVCIPDYWGVFTGNGCQPCTCNMNFAVNNSCMDSQQCYCQPGVAGLPCDQCAPGYYHLTTSGCTSCGCDVYGSQTIDCDQELGTCICKSQAIGSQCNTCPQGYYGLGPWGNQGCINCYCSGQSNNCTTAFGWQQAFVITNLSLASGALFSSSLWSGVNQNNPVSVQSPTLILQNGQSQRVLQIVNVPINATYETISYFVAPSAYLGQKRGAYGQYLNITLSVMSSGLSANAFPFNSTGDVFIEGSDTSFVLVTSLPSIPPINGVPISYSFKLFENVWFINSSTALNAVQATYQQMVQTLASIESITVRATFYIDLNGTSTNLLYASLGYANVNVTSSGNEVFVNNIEVCVCPTGFQGQFCELCMPGYTRLIANGGMFSPCVPCFCNNHDVIGSVCNPESGACNCLNNTTGPQCELCDNGYYGYPASGFPDSCQPCMCPGNVPMNAINAFTTTCSNDGNGSFVCNNCTGLTTGKQCQLCLPGSFGTPTNIANNHGACTSCAAPEYCSGNLGPQFNASVSPPCDSISGNCINCTYNTTGQYCQLCATNYYGVGSLRSCQPCNCNSIGMTGDCDKATGVCICEPFVMMEFEKPCDSCVIGYFNFSSSGCQPCNCSTWGSQSSSCDPETGQCLCLNSFTGRMCNICLSGLYQSFPGICTLCVCNSIGTISMNGTLSACNPVSGQCPCNPGFIGLQCNQCDATSDVNLQYVTTVTLGSFPQCQLCGPCYDTMAAMVCQLGINITMSYNNITALWSSSYNNFPYSFVQTQITSIENSINATQSQEALLNNFLNSALILQSSYNNLTSIFNLLWTDLNNNAQTIMIDQSELSQIGAFTGNVIVAPPNIARSPNTLSLDFLGIQSTQIGIDNSASAIFQNITVLVQAIDNLNATVESLVAAVSAALGIVVASETTQTQTQALYNSTNPTLAAMPIVVDQNLVNGLLLTNQSIGNSLNSANYFLNITISFLNNAANLNVLNQANILSVTSNVQSLVNNAVAAQQTANAALQSVIQLLTAATSAKQILINDILALVVDSQTLAQCQAELKTDQQIVNTIDGTSLNTSEALINALKTIISSSSVSPSQINAMNALAAQDLQIAQNALSITQANLVKAQQVLAQLAAIQSNLTAAKAEQQTAQTGLTNATNIVTNANTVIETVSQKANSSITAGIQTVAALNNIENIIYNIEQTYPNITLSLATTLISTQIANNTAYAASQVENANVNASATLQTMITTDQQSINQGFTILQQAQTELNLMQTEINNLTTYFNIPGMQTEIESQISDINSMVSTLNGLTGIINQMSSQLALLSPNSTYCTAIN